MKDKLGELKLKTYIIQFIYKTGNGWAFVNAYNPSLAQKVFKNQTKYEEAKVVSIKETKWYGENTQVVYEGAVTTYANVDVTVTLKDLIDNSDAFDSVEEYLRSIFNFDDYYNKEQLDVIIGDKIKESLQDIELPDLDLSDYVKKIELKDAIEEELKTIDIPEGPAGKDGITPHINPTNKHWMIGDVDTKVIAEGKNGTNGSNGTDGKNGDNGVGIQKIEYLSTSASGGANKLIITLTDGSTFGPYNIYNGKNGSGGAPSPQSNVDVVELLSLYKGTLQEATERANASPKTMFQFILEAEDNIGNQFTKTIWHIGDGVFIDSLGSVIS